MSFKIYPLSRSGAGVYLVKPLFPVSLVLFIF